MTEKHITIIPIEDHKQYHVNGHLVFKDARGFWQSKPDLTTTEWNAFRNYQKTVINNPRFTKHPKSTFKTKG